MEKKRRFRAISTLDGEALHKYIEGRPVLQYAIACERRGKSNVHIEKFPLK
jgi:hypothetical protein